MSRPAHGAAPLPESLMMVVQVAQIASLVPEFRTLIAQSAAIVRSGIDVNRNRAVGDHVHE